MITLKQISAEIVKFGASRAKLQEHGHVIAMMIVRHAAPTEVPNGEGSGDCTYMVKLAEQMPKSWASQLLQFCVLYTPIRFNVANKKCEYDPKYKKLSAAEKLSWWKMEEAAQNPFHTLSEPESKDTVFDFAAMVKMIEQMAKRVQKQIDDGKVPDEDVATATALVGKISKIKVAHVASKSSNDTAEPQAATKVA